MVSQMIDDLRARGMVAQVSNEDELIEHLTSGMRTVYCGFDPTADSLHIGNLVPLLALRRFQLAGHRPVLLVGGATGMVGDPGGKSKERQLLSQENIAHNVEHQTKQLHQFVISFFFLNQSYQLEGYTL